MFCVQNDVEARKHDMNDVVKPNKFPTCKFLKLNMKNKIYEGDEFRNRTL